MSQDEIVDQEVEDLFGKQEKRVLSTTESWIDIQNLEGRWYTHYLKGMGHKLSSYRDCISLNLTISDFEGEGEKLIEMKDRRRMGTSNDYVLVMDTFKCHIDYKLTNTTLARDKKMSLLSCQNVRKEQDRIKILAQFSTTKTY